MSNEYNGRKIILRDSSGNQMSLPRFFQIGLVGAEGEDTEPSQGFTSEHPAWDISSKQEIGVIPARCPVFGEVTLAQFSDTAGNWVIVREDSNNAFDRWHIFMHLDSISVSVGDIVQQGTELGKIGNTGRVSGQGNGAHLHYQIALSNPQSVNRESENPIDAFDESTLPSGWNMIDAALNLNWDYIDLDHDAVDYNPPTAEDPGIPFFTDKYVYDVSHNQSDSEINELCTDADTGGLIIRFSWNDGIDSKAISIYNKAKNSGIAVGFYSASDKNITNDGESYYRSMLEAQAEILSTSMGIGITDCPIGIWLDLETWEKSPGSAGCGWSQTPVENLRQIQLFRDVFSRKGYMVLGWYTNKDGIENRMLGNADSSWKEFPFWYARPGVSRSSVISELESFGIANCYILQDGNGSDVWAPDKSYKHKNVDNDTILKTIPTAQSGGDDNLSDGNTISVDVDVIPPKRIYFSPNPGILNLDFNIMQRNQEIEITTDAEAADIYFTIDGSAPYLYNRTENGITYELSPWAIKYERSIYISMDSHIRVVAVPRGTIKEFVEILAKGSGTFLFKQAASNYSWTLEQEIYRTQSTDKKIKYYEENKQAFLRYHPEETLEEVLYNSVFLSTEESSAEEQPDSGSEAGGINE